MCVSAASKSTDASCQTVEPVSVPSATSSFESVMSVGARLIPVQSLHPSPSIVQLCTAGSIIAALASLPRQYVLDPQSKLTPGNKVCAFHQTSNES